MHIPTTHTIARARTLPIIFCCVFSPGADDDDFVVVRSLPATGRPTPTIAATMPTTPTTPATPSTLATTVSDTPAGLTSCRWRCLTRNRSDYRRRRCHLHNDHSHIRPT